MKLTLIISGIFYLTLTNGQSVEFATNGRLILGPLKERTASISVGDIDQDGDMDVLVANGRHWPGQNRVFVNNGTGKFMVARALGNEQETSYSTELADFDNDGDLDVAVGNDMAPNYIFIMTDMANLPRASLLASDMHRPEIS